MKKLKTKLILLTLLVCAALPALAQEPAQLRMEQLDRLFPNAVETIDVTIDGSLLRLAGKFMGAAKMKAEEEAAIKEVLNMIKGVYVKGVEFENAGAFNEADIAPLRQQLTAPGWSRIVGVRSKRQGENVEVFMMHNSDVINGIGVLIHSPKKLMAVNVVGPLDPEKISLLIGRFGIPQMDLDFSGLGKSTKETK